MIRRPPRFNRTYTLLPDTTLFRSNPAGRLPTAVADLRSAAFGLLDRPDPVPARRDVHGAQSGATAPVGRCCGAHQAGDCLAAVDRWRSEEHTSELQSLMRISYAVFCLKKKKRSWLQDRT